MTAGVADPIGFLSREHRRAAIRSTLLSSSLVRNDADREDRSSGCFQNTTESRSSRCAQCRPAVALNIAFPQGVPAIASEILASCRSAKRVDGTDCARGCQRERLKGLSSAPVPPRDPHVFALEAINVDTGEAWHLSRSRFRERAGLALPMSQRASEKWAKRSHS